MTEILFLTGAGVFLFATTCRPGDHAVSYPVDVTVSFLWDKMAGI
jgi:hypothetical protein